MSTRPNADADGPMRASHVVETPDRYGNWREYAFSSAPELTDDADADADADSPAQTDATTV